MIKVSEASNFKKEKIKISSLAAVEVNEIREEYKNYFSDRQLEVEVSAFCCFFWPGRPSPRPLPWCCPS